MSTSIAVQPLTEPPDLTVEIPGSKSHTNRALLCAALAPGRSELSRVLFADDTEAMLGAIQALGVTVNADRSAASVTIDGGLSDAAVDQGRPAPVVAVDARQSGTTSRFILPVLATSPGRFVLDGHPQMRSRPFGPQLDALRSVGAEITGDKLPLEVTGRALEGGTMTVGSSMSSQFLSGLLLSAPRFRGGAVIEVEGRLVSRPYVDLTITTMESFGVSVVASPGSDGEEVHRFDVPPQPYRPATIELEPDASAASYFFAAAAMTNGRVRVNGLGRKTVQGDLRFVELLERMGASVTIAEDYTEVAGTGRLTGITADMADISDTVQTLAVVAAVADSPTEIRGVGFIRFKETDRQHAVVTELSRLGLDAVATDDGMIIKPGVPAPGVVETYDDHRMAMSFALLGLRHDGIRVANPGCDSKTFPRFFEVLHRLR